MAEPGMPRVSIIIAAYERMNSLPHTLDACLAQSYGAVEVVVVRRRFLP